MAILDASFLTALYVPQDAHRSSARTWFSISQRDGGARRAPAIALPELVGAIRRRTGRAGAATEAAAQIRSGTVVDLTPLSMARARLAAELAVELRLRGCDAIYVALARELDDVLVTFDREQYDRAKDAVGVLWPGEDG